VKSIPAIRLKHTEHPHIMDFFTLPTLKTNDVLSVSGYDLTLLSNGCENGFKHETYHHCFDDAYRVMPT
jgi:hypothetical protein